MQMCHKEKDAVFPILNGKLVVFCQTTAIGKK